ncbi:MAG TPA: CatB-related O-acetyltransferase [Verrucomicrobiota bacterium]|nr:CatB-related O-acetyltransferase [Verrucomicrobiota bacterium]
MSRFKNYNIGEYTYGCPNVLYGKEEGGGNLVIGKFCSIADDVTIFLGGNHRIDWITTYPFNKLMHDFIWINGHPATKGDVIIGNDVWIGYQSLILSGVKIGDGAVIAARSVVTKDVDPYTIVAGNPARVIRRRFSDEIIQRLLAVQWWNKDMKTIKKYIPLMLSQDIEKFLTAIENEQ